MSTDIVLQEQEQPEGYTRAGLTPFLSSVQIDVSMGLVSDFMSKPKGIENVEWLLFNIGKAKENDSPIRIEGDERHDKQLIIVPKAKEVSFGKDLVDPGASLKIESGYAAAITWKRNGDIVIDYYQKKSHVSVTYYDTHIAVKVDAHFPKSQHTEEKATYTLEGHKIACNGETHVRSEDLELSRMRELLKDIDSNESPSTVLYSLIATIISTDFLRNQR